MKNKRRDKMESVNLINVDGETMKVEIIRYFQFNNNNYLIYSLNEVDEQNYVKLYAVKVENNGGVLVSSNITDESVWGAIKEQIKIIVRGNKDGIAEVADLNYRELESLKIIDSRVFKLSDQLVSLLGANKKVFEEEPSGDSQGSEIPQSESAFQVDVEPITVGPVEPSEVAQPAIETPNVGVSFENFQPEVKEENYKELYEQEQEKVNLLQNKIDEIKKLLE